MGYTVSGLTDYVQNNKDVLIKGVVLGTTYGDTIPNLRKQFGVKTDAKINYLDVDPTLQNGRGCGFRANGKTDLNERQIVTQVIKVNDEWCPDDLLARFAEYLVRFGADSNTENMPFEQEILSEIEKKIDLKMEKLVWQGDGNLRFNGFVTKAEDDGVRVDTDASATVYERIKAVIMAIPEEILDKAVVFVSPALYREFTMEMVEKNYIHFGPDGTVEGKDITFPGTDIKVHKTIGLQGSDAIVASCYENMLYATDLMDDKEEMRLWFSDDDDVFRLKVKWNAGVEYLYPDMVVYNPKGE
jgi:hypothetical protein